MKAKRRQNWLDLALVGAGSIEVAIDMAASQLQSLTDDPPLDTELQTVAINKRAVTEYAAEHREPATGITNEEIDAILNTKQGIGYWRIGDNFVVS